MERHKPIPQPFFPCCIRTPKTHRCLNSLHPNPRDEFRTCWGRVEELLVAGELWIIHKKLIFFPRSSATTCTNRPLKVDQTIFLLGFAKPLREGPRLEEDALRLLDGVGDAEEIPGCSIGSWRRLLLRSTGGCSSIGIGLAVALDLAPQRGICLGAMVAGENGRTGYEGDGVKGRKIEMVGRREGEDGSCRFQW
ncbi:hypothetical protein Taro_043170 [Colocasia esculenta]|uniref:Uncharacterized protein n=1 Tax=Colocasia esculenta TaxID=4460 RepID=A0A843WQQ0_COLES|nr:hypothetical protein [Colocasia esculenta]